jgi:hypothetical protein
VRFAKRWKFVGSAVFEPIWQIVPLHGADLSEGKRLLGEPDNKTTSVKHILFLK